MAIKFLCPLGHRLKVHDDLAGKAGHCPVCRQRVFIPLVSIAPAKPTSDQEEANRVELDDAPVAAPLPPAATPVARPAPPLELPEIDWLANAAPPAIPALSRPAEVPPSVAEPSEGSDEWDSLSEELGLPPRLNKPPKSDAGAATNEAPPPPRRASARPRAGQWSVDDATAAVPIHEPLPALKSSSAKAQPIAKTLAASQTLGPMKTSPAGSPKPPPPQPKPARTATEQPFENLDPLVASLSPRRSSPGPARSVSAPSSVPPSIPRTAAPGFAPSPVAHAGPAYLPDKTKVHTVYMLAAGMAALSIFCAVPGMPHLNLAEAPDWARFVLLLSAMQLVYCVWMATLPDWSTVWVGMVVFALVAAVYGMGLAIATATPADRPVALELSDVRGKAQGWCAAVVLLAGLLTYCCGRVSGQWRRSLATPRVRAAASGAALATAR